MTTDIIKGDMAQALFRSDKFLYLDVKDVLSNVADAVKEAEGLLSSSGKYNQHFAACLLCCALDDIAKLALLRPPFGETMLKFSSLKHRPDGSKPWEYTDGLLHVIKSDKDRRRALRQLYHNRNNEVAHTCVPFKSDDLLEHLGCVKSLAKDTGNFLEVAIQRGGN